MTKAKKLPDLSPEHVGGLFTDGIEYYVLEKCETEPKAEFKVFRSPTGDTIIGPISDFAGMRMINAPRPIEDVKKPRADKGGKHIRKKAQEAEKVQASGTPGPDQSVEEIFNDIKLCPVHREQLTRYPGEDGKGIWQCPQNDCRYQINAKGEQIP